MERSVDVPRGRGVLAWALSAVDAVEMDGLIDMYGGNDPGEEM